MATSRINEGKPPQHFKTPRSHSSKVLVLALLREATPLDVGQALLLSIRGSSRLHDGLGVGRRRGGGSAAHLCWSLGSYRTTASALPWLIVAPALMRPRER